MVRGVMAKSSLVVSAGREALSWGLCGSARHFSSPDAVLQCCLLLAAWSGFNDSMRPWQVS